MRSANSRKRRAPIAWKVPAHTSASLMGEQLAPMTLPEIRVTRRVISAAARREKVINKMRLGSAPLTIRCATRWASVLVLPDPAPAMTRSGGALLRIESVKVSGSGKHESPSVEHESFAWEAQYAGRYSEDSSIQKRRRPAITAFRILSDAQRIVHSEPAFWSSWLSFEYRLAIRHAPINVAPICLQPPRPHPGLPLITSVTIAAGARAPERRISTIIRPQPPALAG